MFRNKYMLGVLVAAIAVVAWGVSSAFGSGSPAIHAPVTSPTDSVQTVIESDGTVGTIELKTGTPVRVSGSKVSAARRTGRTTASTCGTYYNTATQTYSAKLWFLPVGHTSHTFKWYYNCNAAWISLRNGYSGYHRCGGGWNVGVSVDVMDCTKTNDPSTVATGTAVKPFYQFKVSALFDGFPASFTKGIQACLTVYGNVFNCN